jgi:putative peptide zinc metalloprotease protein
VAAKLPPLRQELRLHPGPAAPDGAPSWLLHDPPRNRFFRIGWAEFELLRRWEGQGAEGLLALVNTETPLRIGMAHLEALVQFLSVNQLLAGSGEAFRDRLEQRLNQGRQGLGTWLLHHYLFFRIPLARPDAFLQRTLPLVRFLFTPAAFKGLLLLTLLGLFLISRQWDAFTTTLLHFQSLEGLLYFGLAVSFAKLFHELGHGYAAKAYGLRVPTMGVAFLVMWPVLYTENSDAWRLTDRAPRLIIGAAGVATELALAGLAALCWSFLPDGPLRSAAFLLASATWVLALLVNLNPFMRFDGYYLLSDLLGVANLQERAFALGRWRLREALFGLGRAPPERHSPRLHRILLWYAWGTWVYRFLLFLGIALLVYHFFFKALGILLMLAEIGWFILRPLWQELREWGRARPELRWNRATLRSLALLLLAVGLLCLPWQGQLHLPALLEHPQHARIFAPLPGRIAELLVGEGERVAPGQPLLRLEGPDLGHQIGQAGRRLAELELTLQQRSSSPEGLEQGPVLVRQRAEAEATLRGLQEQQERLVIRAPLAGQVVFLEPTLTAGRWVNDQLLLAQIAEPAPVQVRAYAGEAALGRIPAGAVGRFYPETPELPVLELVLRDMDRTGTHWLQSPYLPSVYGGPIPARREANGRVVSEGSIHRLRLEVLPGAPGYTHIERGQVRLEVAAESLMVTAWRRVTAVLLREAGF